jgi:hypothetical protein
MRLHLILDILHFLAVKEVEKINNKEDEEIEKREELENAKAKIGKRKKGKRNIFFPDEIDVNNKLQIGGGKTSTTRELAGGSDKKFVKTNLKESSKTKAENPYQKKKSIWLVPGTTKELSTPKGSKEKGSTPKKRINMLHEKKKEGCIKPLSASHMSSLGLLSHVFFDKTDTLTHSSLPPILTHLSTP